MIASLSDLLHSIRLLRADAAQLRIGANAAVRLQMREAVHLHLVIEGETRFFFPTRDHTLTLRPGQFLFAPPGTDHVIGQAEPHAASVLRHFEDCQAGDAPPQLQIGPAPLVSRLLTCALYIDHARHDALIRMLPELRSYRSRNGPTVFCAVPLLNMEGLAAMLSGPGASAMVARLAELMLVDATRSTLIRDLSPALGDGIPDMPQIGAALRALYQDPARRWSIGSLAHEVGMSRSAFAAAFSRIVKDTPMRFLTAVRMTRAQNLLKDGSHSLPEIAHLTGYDSEAAFARAFKRETGVSPGNYRRALRGYPEGAAPPDD